MGRQKKHSDLPQVTDLLKPTIQVLIDLGGSGNIEEINEGVYQLMKLSENVLSILHSEDGRSEVDYRLAWARTVLKRYGLLDNSSRGVWALTKSDININKLDPEEIEKTVRDYSNQNLQTNNNKLSRTYKLTLRLIMKSQHGKNNFWTSCLTLRQVHLSDLLNDF